MQRPVGSVQGGTPASLQWTLCHIQHAPEVYNDGSTSRQPSGDSRWAGSAMGVRGSAGYHQATFAARSRDADGCPSRFQRRRLPDLRFGMMTPE